MSTPPPAQTVPAPPALPPQGQAESLRLHRRQTVWQIWAPLWVFILIILGMAAGVIFSAAGASPEVGRWASMSLIMLITPTLLVALIFLVVAAGLVYLMARALHALPVYTQLGQAYAHLFSVMVRVWADRAASPVITIRGVWAGWETLLRRIF
jgi:hypothetical protein